MLLFSLALLALCASTKANDDRESYSHHKPNSTASSDINGGYSNHKPNVTVSSDINEDSFPHVTVSLGSVALVILVGIFIYYFCCRNKGQGFMQFTDHNEGDPPRRNNRWRWRNRRGNRRQNYMNNSQEARHSTHVVIQPVVNMALPSLDQNSSVSRQDDFSAAGDGNFNTAPPTYDDSMSHVMQNNWNNTANNTSFSHFNRY